MSSNYELLLCKTMAMWPEARVAYVDSVCLMSKATENELIEYDYSTNITKHLKLVGLIGSACLATVVLLAMKSTLSLSVLPLLRCGSGMQAFSHLKLTLRGPFAQRDHLGVFHYVID